MTIDGTGTRLASAGSDGAVRIWDVESGTLLATYIGGEEGAAVILPNGRYKLQGDVGGRAWHLVGLVRFELGELDQVFPQLRMREDEPSWGD